MQRTPAIKICPACYMVLHAATKKCPNCQEELTMRKRKEKKLTKDQKAIAKLNEDLNGMQCIINQKNAILQGRDKEIATLNARLEDARKEHNDFDRKLHEVRDHVSAALNHSKGIKPLMQQQEAYQIIGKMQGRLEAAQGYDSYGLSHGTVSLVDVKSYMTTRANF